MPLDPRINLAVQPPQIEGPLNAFAQAENLRTARNRNAFAEMELQQAQDPAIQEAAQRQAFIKNAQDVTEYLKTNAGRLNETNIGDFVGTLRQFGPVGNMTADSLESDPSQLAQLQAWATPKQNTAADYSGSLIVGEDGQFYRFNKRTGQVEATGNAPGLKPTEQIPYQGQLAATKAGESAKAEAMAKQAATAPADIANAQYAIDLLEKAKNHPGRQMATGFSSVLPAVPGTATADFGAIMDQIKGKQFLEAFSSLKGGGTITEVEGRKAEQAIARLDTAQSEPEFLNALTELQDVIAAGMERKRQGVTVTPQVKTIPLANVRYTAEKKGWTLDQAIREAEARGYTVK